MEIGGEKVQLGIPDQLRGMASMLIPIGRPGTPQEAAGGVFFLCSPWSNFVHGQVLNITAGQFTGDDDVDRRLAGRRGGTGRAAPAHAWLQRLLRGHADRRGTADALARADRRPQREGQQFLAARRRTGARSASRPSLAVVDHQRDPDRAHERSSTWRPRGAASGAGRGADRALPRGVPAHGAQAHVAGPPKDNGGRRPSTTGSAASDRSGSTTRCPRRLLGHEKS
jgi:hypothetical protein